MRTALLLVASLLSVACGSGSSPDAGPDATPAVDAGDDSGLTVGQSSTGSCSTYGTRSCLEITSDRPLTLSVVTPFGSDPDLEVAPDAPARFCFCRCTCAPGSAVGEAVITTSEGAEVRVDLGVGGDACCETFSPSDAGL